MRFILGTAQFGLDYGINNSAGAVSCTEIERILSVCIAGGINTLDTAILYGNSEEKLGRVGIRNWNVITKLPLVPSDVANIYLHWSKELSGSCQRLRIDSFEAILLHRPQQLLEPCGASLYAALQRLKADGIMRKIGISVYGPQEALQIAKQFPIDLVQMPVSILDQRLLTSNFGSFARANAIEIHARSVYLQGLLLMTRVPAWFAQWQAVFDEWHDYLHRNRLSAIEACIRFVAAQDLLSGLVIGVDRASQLEDLLDLKLRPLRDLPQWPAYDDVLINPSQWK